VGIAGWAWAANGVTTLEVSVDDGNSWVVADLAPRSAWAWQKFRCRWRPAAAGIVACLRGRRTPLAQPSR